jgi:hypothetical protein
MTRNRVRAAGALSVVAFAVVACENDDQRITGPTGQAAFTRYVSIGTSVSMGVLADGVLYSTQGNSWPAQLVNKAIAASAYSIPFIQGPGCHAPIITPLQFGLRLDKKSSATSDTSATGCAANFANVTLPGVDTFVGGANVAISGAKAYDALYIAPESATVRKIGNANGRIYSRVLAAKSASGVSTQVTAMMHQNPTLVSVELGANEVLPIQVGLVAPNVTYTPLTTFTPIYDAIIDSVKKTGAKAVLVGLVDVISKFPVFIKGSEVAAETPTFAAFNVAVQPDCGTTNANNLLHGRGKILATVAFAATQATPVPLSCADVVGTVDYVVSTAEAAAVQAVVTSYNTYIEGKATANGFAYFELGALYDNPGRPAWTTGTGLVALLTGNSPFGPNVSADGVHPTKAGQTILANAAAAALNTRYGFALP